MFTSRAEHRLMLRHDTADTRLLPKARDLGLISEERWERFRKKIEGLEAIQELMREKNISSQSSLAELRENIPELSSWPEEWVERVRLDAKYSGYIEKEKRAAAKLSRMDAVKISPDMDYNSLTGLSAEAKEKLKAVRPLTVGQAARVPGVRQGDIALLMVLARKG